MCPSYEKRCFFSMPPKPAHLWRCLPRGTASRDAVFPCHHPARAQPQGRICPCKETSPLQPWGWPLTTAEGDGAHTTDGIWVALIVSGHVLLDERGFGFLGCLQGSPTKKAQVRDLSALSSPHSVFILNLRGQT